MTLLRVWAPAARRVDAVAGGVTLPMRRSQPDGWWEVQAGGPDEEVDYAFRLDGGPPLADPRSPRQPSGPDGPSRTLPATPFEWHDASWRGMTLPGAVIYELHVGTFTPAGTLDAAADRLDHLARLGVTAVELMPVAAFPGHRNWGYDGIALWAVQEDYGGPRALQRFVDRCHQAGLAVILDVVYNHAGPGNRLAEFGPYFTAVYATPWGEAVNLDQPGSDEVRAFCVGNAVRWLRDFHVDGLRLDAVHALQDRRAVPLLEELAEAVDALSAATGRPRVLIAESDLNDPRLIKAREAGGYGLDGQWSDDLHHAVHAAVTGERQGYYADFGTMAALAKTLTGAFFHDGTWSMFRGRSHGRPVDRSTVPAYRFVCCLQDHDQVGNRAAGDRIATALSPALLRVAAGLVLTAPFTPMLFMGEEWGADTPFGYFTDHTDPFFAEAVRNGRRAEFAAHGWDAAQVPDPQDPATFTCSKLDWSQPAREPHASVLAWYTRLLALRRARPEITSPRMDQTRVEFDEQARWLVMHRGRLRVAANLGTAPAIVPLGAGGPAGPERPAALDGSAGPDLLAASAPGITVGDELATLPGPSFAVIAL